MATSTPRNAGIAPARRIVAHSYGRYSTAEQSQGDSERRQDDAFDNYCATHDRQPGTLYRDRGISAHRGRNATEGDLARFLDEVKSGAVRPSDELVIEDLDRLSRQPPLESLDLLRAIVKAGVVVVTLIGGARWYDEARLNDDFGLLVQVLSAMFTAHNESSKKVDRIGKTWKENKANASGDNLLTTKVPGWLAVEYYKDGTETKRRAVKIPAKVEIIRRAVAMVTGGVPIGNEFVTKKSGKSIGTHTVVRIFREEGVPNVGRDEKWSTSGLRVMLRSRALIGEYQPHRTTTKKEQAEAKKQGKKLPSRVTDGAVKLNYYPAILSMDEWRALQNAIDGRRSVVKGGSQARCANLFSRLLKCGEDGSTMTLRYKDPTRIMATCCEGHYRMGKRHNCNYVQFEREFLTWVSKDLKLDDDRVADRSETIAADLSLVTRQLDEVNADLAANPSKFTGLYPLAKSLAERQSTLAAELEIERMKSVSPIAAAQAEAGDLYERLARLKGDELVAARQRIAAAIRRLVVEVKVWSEGYGWKRRTWGEVTLTGGSTRQFMFLGEGKNRQPPQHRFGQSAPGNWTHDQYKQVMTEVADALTPIETGIPELDAFAPVGGWTAAGVKEALSEYHKRIANANAKTRYQRKAGKK